MKIDSITLHNFKCFADTVHIDDLSSGLTSQKRVVLFGGLNGAGKTSLLEAILLCLYGARNKSLIPSKGTKYESYESYIKSIANNNAKLKVRTEMFVELALSEVEVGDIAQSLRLKRTWILTQGNSSLEEQFTIMDEDGQPSSFVGDFISKENYDEFIEELIPYDVSQFFFFDGEKIQEFVRDEDREFAESLEKVLGLSLYRTLYNDIVRTRRLLANENNENENVMVEIATADARIVEYEQDIRRAEDQIGDLQDEIYTINQRIDEIDVETRRITKIKAETLDDYEVKREGLVAEKGVLEQQIFEAVKADLPFVIMAQLCEQLVQQLDQEQELEKQMTTQKALAPKITQITNKLLYEGLEAVPMLTHNQKEFYVHKLTKILEDTLAEKPKTLTNVKLIHNLAKDDVQNIRQRVNNSFETIDQLTVSLQRLQEIEPILGEIRKATRQTNNPEAEGLYQEKGALQEQIRTKENEIEVYHVEIDKSKAEIQAQKILRTNLEAKAEAVASRQKQIEYCRKLCKVIDDFSNEFRTQRAERLESYTLTMWQKLAQKQDLIKQIVVNPDRHFSIDLYDAKDRLIDKTKLSAGEKELLAISLISALSQIADRALPIVIDTPLGRLDSEHRANIAEYYFPNISHQVLLLSTDTEIVAHELQVINPYVSKVYTITNNETQQISTIQADTYFE